MRSPGPCPKQKTISFAEITKPDHRILNTFYFTKISYVWGIVQAAAPEGGGGGRGSEKLQKRGGRWCLKKVILSCLKMNLKISHKLRY